MSNLTLSTQFRAANVVSALHTMAANCDTIEKNDRDLIGDITRTELKACAKKLRSLANSLAISVDVQPKETVPQ